MFGKLLQHFSFMPKIFNCVILYAPRILQPIYAPSRGVICYIPLPLPLLFIISINFQPLQKGVCRTYDIISINLFI